MVQAVVAKNYEYILELGDEEDPEVWTPLCGFTSKGVDFSASTSKSKLPDCDPDVIVGWEATTADTLSASVSGSGVAEKVSKDELWTWFKSGGARHARLRINKPVAAGGGDHRAMWIITSLNLSADDGTPHLGMSISLEADGTVEWVDAIS